MPTVSKFAQAFQSRRMFQGKNDPMAGTILICDGGSQSIATTATGNYTFGFSFNGWADENSKVVRVGAYVFKLGQSGTEDWYTTTNQLAVTTVTLAKASADGVTTTQISGKGDYYDGGAWATILSASTIAGGISSNIDNADEWAYFEFREEETGHSAAFTAANNVLNALTVLRLHVQLTNNTSGTIVPFVMPFVEINRMRV